MKLVERALLVAMLASCGKSLPAQPFVGKLPDYKGGHFAVIGDTQRTTSAGLMLQNENNDAERKLLLPMLASRRPTFIVMVGDLVSVGSSDEEWREFEDRTKSIRDSRIPVLAVLGNHEYMLSAKSGVRHFFDRTPDLEGAEWYARTHGPLGMLFLNSNVDELKHEEREAQLTWYLKALEKMQNDPNVLGILVFMHHPPFTNSSLVGDNDYARLNFVPPFMIASKAMAMITGHAHGYERFQLGPKVFIVSAGGGGPRFPILTGDKRRHTEEKYTLPGRRHFNFVELSFRQEGLHAVVVGLPKDKKDFCQMDELDLKWPALPAGPIVPPADEATGPPTLPACN